MRLIIGLYFGMLVLSASALHAQGNIDEAANSDREFPDSLYVMDKLYAFAADGMMGRSTYNSAMEKARNFLITEFQDIGLTAYVPEYVQEFEITGENGDTVLGKNLLAYVEGNNKNELIVLSAHYDHIGISDSANIYNGADDNASGTIALLEMAKYFSRNKPEHSMVFAFFDAEELGLLGAKHFVNSMVAADSMIKLNVNMDMVARGDENELYAVGTYFYPQLKIYIKEAAKDKSINMIFGADAPKDKPNWVNASDHGAFNKVNIPFVYFGVDDHEDYHKTSDTADKIDPGFYLKAIELIRDAVINFDANLELVILGSKK